MSERLRFVLALIVVAVGAAFFAAAFRSSLGLIYQVFYDATQVVEAFQQLTPWMRLVVVALGAFVAGLIARLSSPVSQGVSNVMEAVALGNVRLSFRTTLRRVSCSWIAIATGMSIGREGPLIEFGGSLGATAARLLGQPLLRVRILVAAGTAAGFAAAYNTPFAGVLFVLETIVGIVAMEALLPTMVATLIATAITRAIVGGGPIYGQRSFVASSPVDLASFAVLGVVAAVAAFAFKHLLGSLERWIDAHPLRQPTRATLGGLCVGAIAMWVPEVAGNGYEPLNFLLDGQMMAKTVLVLVLAKAVATSSAVGSGIPGGVFTPMLLVGGATGTLWAHLLTLIGVGSEADPGSYALVGMAATTAASIHAPLTAAVLVFELSGDYPIVLPLILATVVATALSRGLGGLSIYEAELRRKGVHWTVSLDGRQIRESHQIPRPGS
jgi:CIC family chloride channel protein